MKKKTGSKKVSPLEFAIALEIKGVNFYLNLASKTDNPLGKKLFYSLAGEEIDHAKRIDAIFNKFKGDDSHRHLLMKTMPSVSNDMKNFFLKAKTRDIEKGKEDLSGYKLAMKMEKSSYSTYEEFAQGSDNDEERSFFKTLMKEEKEHLEALVNVYSYLTKTDDWFQNEESKVWNWMNM